MSNLRTNGPASFSSVSAPIESWLVVTSRGNAGSNRSAIQDASEEIAHEKTPAKTGVDGCGSSVTTTLAPPAGLEPATNGLTVRCSTN